ncbi:MAG: class I SAM-dependent methyltransferase family protein [Asgard group archaeon]|nr:class I SAM-dependent methyltransferase family protein [Asgard group archaeon]
MKIEKRFTEQIRKVLYEESLLNLDYKIENMNDKIILPLTKQLSESELAFFFPKSINLEQITMDKLTKVKSRPKSHLDILGSKLSIEDMVLVPRSFDTIGDIVVIEIPKELWVKRFLIGEALLEAYSSIKSVYAKTGKVSGINRIRPVEYLVGEKKTKTIYKEHGVRLSVDITKAYFSPRLSEEHSRITKKVENNEIVIDLFCGIGPFAIPIAKKNKAIIHAIDINPEAIKLLNENINLNKLSGEIHPYIGDCREVVQKEKLIGIADRVIMNLPGYAIDFVDVACQVLKIEGGIIHFFEFVGGDIPPEEQIVNDITEAVKKNNRNVEEILEIRRVRMSAPKQWQMVVDVVIK